LNDKGRPLRNAGIITGNLRRLSLRWRVLVVLSNWHSIFILIPAS
jgi:hypothetical protein